ncbi:MAG: amidohydrolase family protein [Bacteroidetes bacterium]|nr:amidohydrolase family protein [Bacteroidota bacterium]
MIVLKNTNLIQFYPPKIYYNVDVIIENEIIIDTGRNVGDNYKSDKTLNLNNKFISTGLVCSHNHFYSVLARGILADINTCNNFLDILKNLWWKLDRAIDEESLYYSGIIGALEAIKSGTTSVIDHNASPNFISGSLSTLKKAFETAGLRGILAYEITDRNGIDGLIEGVKESIKFAENIENDKKESKE